MVGATACREQFNEKKFILFCPGPEHLFWAGGFYLAWELSRTYRVVLVTDHHFNDLERVKRLIGDGVLHDFIPFVPHKASFLGIRKAYLKHKYFKLLADNIFRKYEFAAVIQHTDLGPPNMYLFRKSGSENILRILYRASTVPKDYYNDYVILKNLLINRLQNDLGLGRPVASALFHLRQYFGYYFNFWLVPLMLTGRIFKPRINSTFRKKRFLNKNRGDFDFAIIYSEREKKITDANGEPSSVVRDPLYVFGDEANKYLFEGVAQKNQILILPTSGEIELFVKSNAGPPADKVAYYASQWAEAIKIIQGKFPGFETCIKYHPAGSGDALFDQAINFLTSANRGIRVIDRRESAEKLIVESRVIVGTFTSALWWASELPSAKTVISLDVWGVSGGDRFSEVEGIHYFKSLGELGRHDFTASRVCAKYTANVPTVTDFIMEHSQSRPPRVSPALLK